MKFGITKEKFKNWKVLIREHDGMTFYRDVKASQLHWPRGKSSPILVTDRWIRT